MLRHLGTAELADDVRDLTRFQADAVHRLHRIMNLRGGAVLADSVGLGKTHVALALMRRHVRDGGTAAVVAPAALRSHWQRHLRSVPDCRYYSHAALSRASGVPRAASLIVVDEAHAFRNPRARRYAVLARLCTDSTALLLTATPVNNTLFDFYHLLRLFARDDSFCDVGVPDLRAAAQQAADGVATEALRNVARHVMVRRSREFIERHYGIDAVIPEGGRLRFPMREPLRAARYELGAAYPDLDRSLAGALEELTFPVHAASGQPVPADLLRMGLLKRLESSTAAFNASLRGYGRLLIEFIDAADAGYLLDAHSRRRLMPEVDGSVQLAMRGMVLRCWPGARDRDAFIAAARSDLEHVRGLGAVFTPAEPKLATLQALLPEFADERVLIFTEYRHTARMLWRNLSAAGGVALIAGDEARLGNASASRRAILQRFTTSSGHRLPQHQQVRILVATDVLSEGLNLQQARVVVSYDVPWNPVRLAQRIGRIDRLGSPHRSIVSVVFVPDRRLDAVLQLMDRIRRKLRHIRVVGGDTPWPARRKREPGRILEGEALEVEPRLRIAWRRAREAGVREACGSAAVQWDQPYHGALVCVSHGPRSWLVLCREGRRPDIAGADGEAVAADILKGRLASASAEPDAAWLARMGRQAVRAVRSALDGRGIPIPGAGTTHAVRGARVVHRWLRDRPGGGSREDCARAERILDWLSTPLSVADEHRLGQAVGSAGPGDAVVRRLEALAAEQPANTSSLAPSAGEGSLKVVAGVELVPAARSSL